MQDESFTDVVSAVSHSAVNEALLSILELREGCAPGDDDDVELIRICSSGGQGIDDDRIVQVEYNDRNSFEKLE